MRNIRLFTVGLAACTLTALFTPALAAPSTAHATTTTTAPAAETRFMRFVGDSKTGGSLQTADITFENDQGVKVRLVSAVHIADHDYFQSLNDSFKSCDVVLYEMVKPKDAGAPQPGAGTSDIAKFQRFLKDTLDLDYQLDTIDYNAPNFVHADLSAEEFQRMQAARGESIPQLMLASMLKQLANPGAAEEYADEPTDTFDLMTRPDGTRQFKLILARRMGDIEKDVMGGFGMDGTVILTERNKAAVKVLREQIKSGKKNLAVFYGAAHMPDLSDRLDLMGFHPTHTEWHKAWDVTIRDNQPSAFQRVLDLTAKAATQPSNAP